MKHEKRLVGIITAVTGSCYYICCEKKVAHVAKNEKKRTKKSEDEGDVESKPCKLQLQVHRIIKQDNTLAILLPDKLSQLSVPENRTEPDWNDTVVAVWGDPREKNGVGKVCILPATKSIFVKKQRKQKG